jgi:hypothetical protein
MAAFFEASGFLTAPATSSVLNAADLDLVRRVVTAGAFSSFSLVGALRLAARLYAIERLARARSIEGLEGLGMIAKKKKKNSDKNTYNWHVYCRDTRY